MKLTSTVILALAFLGASCGSHDALQEIPDPDQTAFQAIRDARDWRNPYLVVGPSEIELLGVRSMKLEELESALVHLPKSSWPYGRVVAVQESGVGSGSDSQRTKENVSKVLRVLKKLGITPNPWPSA